MMLHRVLDRIFLIGGYLSGFFLFSVCVLMLALSLSRRYGADLPSADDYAAWSMAACAFLGLAHTFRKGEMIRVGLLLDRMTGPTRQLFEILSLGLVTAFVSFFAWHAGKMTYESWFLNDMSQGVVPVPLWFPQLGMSLGLVLLAIALVEEMVHLLRGNPPSYLPPPPKSAEEVVERAAQGGGV